MKNTQYWIAVPLAVLALVGALNLIGQTPQRPAVIVRDLDNGDRADGGSGHVFIELADGVPSGSACMLAPVPAGTRRIVRHVFATVTVPPGQSPLAWAAYGNSAGTIILGNERPFVMVSQGASSATQTRFVGSTPMHLRYDAGSTICFAVSRYPATGVSTATLGYAGYTIDYP